jgi:adenylate cyclase
VGTNVDLTAMGDPVNVTARLASAAGPGEVLVTLGGTEAADLDTSDLEQRDLVLRGKSSRIRVVVLRASVSTNI